MALKMLLALMHVLLVDHRWQKVPASGAVWGEVLITVYGGMLLGHPASDASDDVYGYTYIHTSIKHTYIQSLAFY